MAYQRRRHHHHQQSLLQRLLRRQISATTASLLLLLLLILLFLACLSFFAPSPFLNHHHHHRSRSSNSSTQQNLQTNGAGGADASRPKPIFQIPDGGGRNATRRSRPRLSLWGSKLSHNFFGCSNASSKFPALRVVTRPDRYLLIATSGGLNQQRTGITDAVVVARILNATLVIPKLDAKSFWRDSSDFTEIFDADWFISSLSKDVKTIKELPKKGGKVIRAPYNMRVPRKCTPRCYMNRVLPVLLKKHVVQLSKFDYRLANRLDTDFQKLRCRVNYHALRFTDPIQVMGETLIRRMRERSKHFIALHLRFEPDMLAFSGCYYGGGVKEQRELGKIRKRWKTLHINNPEKARRHGRCPLTPEEVGLMLRALGYGNDVHIYVASGEVYGGEGTLAPLKALFPNFHSKETLASKVELAPFSSFSSRMAALDFIVCDESDAFVTNNNGNMAKILAGRRRYFGHKRTIRPNAKRLYSLFENRANLTWEVFASKVRSYQRGSMGEPNEMRPGRGEFHENPSTCICEKPEAKKVAESGGHSQAKADTEGRKESLNTGVGEPTSKHDTDEDGQDNDEDPEIPDFDDESPARADGTSNETMLDYDLFMRSEEPELEEMFSD
ncbi:uncharacterized protein M6B38_309475 [Iris pallida]|uniref:O-fucosyltransferase family protein n=1 Tax=Iris pallida TaxID=29817 RepID=A0AAX6HIK7_IRIPA|nr:uncharacterized protein M6B38_309475 [Iris pallida]